MKTGTVMLTMVALTSIGAYVVGRTWLGLERGALRSAVDRMFQCIGAMLVFTALNVGLTAAAILGVRVLTRTFVSIYVVNDITWLGFSLLQGLTFWWWRELSRELPRPRRGRGLG